jgi:hypothetical protein
MKAVMIAVTGIGLLQGPALANTCYEPSAPSCVTGYGGFEDEDEFLSCKGEMESYQSDVEAYLECLKHNSQEAIDAYNDAINSFNHRAQSN